MGHPLSEWSTAVNRFVTAELSEGRSILSVLYDVPYEPTEYDCTQIKQSLLTTYVS